MASDGVSFEDLNIVKLDFIVLVCRLEDITV